MALRWDRNIELWVAGARGKQAPDDARHISRSRLFIPAMDSQKGVVPPAKTLQHASSKRHQARLAFPTDCPGDGHPKRAVCPG